MKRRSLRSLFLWMANLALWMSILAPSISQALQPREGANWALVCTALGSQWVAINGQAPKPDAAHLFQHCPYCTLHTAAIETPQVKLAPALRTLRYELQWTDAAPKPTREAWFNTRARGPPLSA